LPVYRNGLAPVTVAERRQQFLGALCLVIRIDDMLQDIFGPALLGDLDIEIYDSQTNGRSSKRYGIDTLIFDSGLHAGAAAIHAGNREFPRHRRHEIVAGGEQWELVITALPTFVKHSQSWLPPIATLAMILLSLLGFFFVRLLERSQRNLGVHVREVEQALDSNARQLARITESIDAALWTVEVPGGRLKYVSAAVERISGQPHADFYSNPSLWQEITHPDDRARLAGIVETIAGNGSATYEYRIVRPDGEVRWIRCEAHFIPGATPGAGEINGIDSDITEQRRLEQSLLRSNRALRAFHECEEVIVRSEDEGALLQGICDVVAKVGYRLAWAGVLDHDGNDHIVPVGLAGEDEGYLGHLKPLLAADSMETGSTVVEALQTHRPVVIDRFDRDTDRMPWRQEALRRGFNSKITLPLLHDDDMMGLLNVYASEQEAFDGEAVALLADLAHGVTVAMQALRQRSARQAAEEAAHLRERAIEASANAVIITSARAPDYAIEYVNSAFERMTGYAANEVIGRSLRFLHREDCEQPGLEEIRALIKEQREGHATVRNYRKDGSLFWSDVHIAPVKDETGRTCHFVAAKYDITATKKYEAELEYQSSRDLLTGLANRTLLRDRLTQAIAFAARYQHPIWVVFLNLDRFKIVNDTLGFQSGDLLLKSVAERLNSAARESDSVARMGSDEFVLILPECSDETLCTVAVQRIMDAVAQPLVIAGHEIFPVCSAGLAVYPGDGEDAEELVKHAHIAMYRAKEAGGNGFRFYTPAMNQRASEMLRMESDLRNALERDEFELYYQPQVELRTGRVVGMEALLRWNHPEFGMLLPDRFIGLAEESGMIVPIGAWVMRRACRQSKRWQEAGFGCLRVAVNLSVRQFAQEDLAQSIAATLLESGLEAHCLDIEVTETLVMADVERAVGTLRALKELGVHLSVDDFGTGYSSLAYLKRFPIDVLKIDKSFVQDVTKDPDSAAIVRSVISLAHSLHLQVIAEGVETEAQLCYLRRHSCDQMQGYYFSKPLPVDAFEQLLAQGRALALAQEEMAGEQQTLLIVDDEVNVTSALHRLLRLDGYRILIAHTPEAGFELLARHSVQVILCDQVMPAMRGTEFLSKVKDLYPHTIRIVLSGYTQLESVLGAINRGAIYRFFTKPWDDEILRDNVREAFHDHRLLHRTPASTV
jgi:diguanylate cyclase (GGDEF)-like protein/PAS domain S-box-containing protein